ncbi:MAG: hybrid sensor histidine kinase/response regulator [Planctomycetales bacterium]|nr:hybrid sensor histidine kinase/response regulator [Planctomycetales bacterium]
MFDHNRQLDTLSNHGDVRVLVVDDDGVDMRETLRALSHSIGDSFEITTAHSLTSATKLLSDSGFDVVLLDLGLPESSGLDTLREIRTTIRNVPIIVVSDINDEDTALQALDYGAQDYFIKGTLTSDLLRRSIRYAIHRQKLVQNLRENEKTLQKNQEMLQAKNLRLEALCDTAHKFVDNVSHEFRTPLTVIKEYTSLMLDGIAGSVSDEQRRMLNIVSDRTNDLGNMVDDMLDISKMQSGLMGLLRCRCRIEDILRSVRPCLARKAEIKSVKIEFVNEPDLPELYCDPEKIGRVITNLTVNAIKFCGDPGIVQVTCKLADNGEDIVVEVTDNGRGIDAESLQSIFERFTQLGSDVRSSTKGFGLGLSICKELVQLNFGQMNVQSKLGHGSAFSFTVPVYEPQCILRRYLSRIDQLEGVSRYASLVEVRVDESSDADDANDVDSFLSYLLRRHDIIFRVDSARWLLVLAANDIELPDFFSRAQQTLDDANRNRFKGPFPHVEWNRIGTWHASYIDTIVVRSAEAFQTRELMHG